MHESRFEVGDRVILTTGVERTDGKQATLLAKGSRKKWYMKLDSGNEMLLSENQLKKIDDSEVNFAEYMKHENRLVSQHSPIIDS